MKDSFVLYTKYQTQMDLLDMAQRGLLFTVIMAYVAGDELPEMDDVVAMAFSFIKADLDRDAIRYEQTCEARREAGRIGGINKAANEKKKVANLANASFAKTNVANLADNEYEYDSDSKEKTTYVVQKKGGKQPPTIQEIQEYITEKGYDIDAQLFVDYYASQNWKKNNGQPLTDWKAGVRNWVRRDKQRLDTAAKVKPTKFSNFPQRSYDYEDLERRLSGVIV